ncbi:unnamed protein product [Aphis gossypii]|uniref:Uncharacterized protein n=1 Tax=Aphis gossypii TaxID=80765 RepID=A0A9P0IPZ2_APHGO|nr:unnamed protein product [Aphis gossypii]
MMTIVCVCERSLSISLFLTFRLYRGGGLRPGRFLQSPHDVFTIHNHNTYIVHCRDRIVFFFFVLFCFSHSSSPCASRRDLSSASADTRTFFPPGPRPVIIAILPGFLRVFFIPSPTPFESYSFSADARHRARTVHSPPTQLTDRETGLTDL